eukprot:2271804-Rhodomonas_salina.2
MCGTDLALGAVALRACYAMCSTDLAMCGTTLRACYAMCGTDLAMCGTTLRACYAMCGTDLAYGAGRRKLSSCRCSAHTPAGCYTPKSNTRKHKPSTNCTRNAGSCI